MIQQSIYSYPQYFENTVFGYKFNDKTIRDFTRKFCKSIRKKILIS